jgi:hypothetical protein
MAQMIAALCGILCRGFSLMFQLPRFRQETTKWLGSFSDDVLSFYALQVFTLEPATT